MGTMQTINHLQTAIGDIDASISGLDSLKMAIAMEASNVGEEFDSGQDFASSVVFANTNIDFALAELKKARSSLQGVMAALR